MLAFCRERGREREGGRGARERERERERETLMHCVFKHQMHNNPNFRTYTL